jgi:hypothetical protein
VAGVAAQHGGSATAANAPGGGAVFTIRMPLVAGPVAAGRADVGRPGQVDRPQLLEPSGGAGAP